VLNLAVAVGFEPTVDFHPHALSRSRWQGPRASATRGRAWTTHHPNRAVRPGTPADETFVETKLEG